MLEDLINKNYKQLNENDLYIWGYVSKHKRECVNMSIDELANRCNVSRTTILRFSKRLGLSGYSEFKVYLRMSNEQVIHKGANIEKLHTSYVDYTKFLSTYNYSDIIKLIQEANNLYVYGRGTIQKNVANEMKRSFLFADKLFYGITSLGETVEYEEMITSGDVIVVISFSGETPIMLEFVRKLKIKHVRVIAISATKQNSLSAIADISVSVDNIALHGPVGPFYGLSGYFLFIDYLIAAYLEEVYQ